MYGKDDSLTSWTEVVVVGFSESYVFRIFFKADSQVTSGDVWYYVLV